MKPYATLVLSLELYVILAASHVGGVKERKLRLGDKVVLAPCASEGGEEHAMEPLRD